MARAETGLLEILERHNEAWNQHDLEALMLLFDDDCVFEASGGTKPVARGTRDTLK